MLSVSAGSCHAGYSFDTEVLSDVIYVFELAVGEFVGGKEYLHDELVVFTLWGGNLGVLKTEFAVDFVEVSTEAR